MSQLPIKSPFKVGRETIPHSLINFIRIFLMNEETAKAKFEDMKTAQKVRFINGGASFQWSFGPHSVWGSIESTTILTTHPSLPYMYFELGTFAFSI